MHRLLSREGLLDKHPGEPVATDRRRFAFRYAGECWQSDVMHGPKVRDGRTRRKTYLIAFLDDATRAIPFAAFAFSENTTAFLPVFKNALIRRGCPMRLFVDNGANYRSQQLALVCCPSSMSPSSTPVPISRPESRRIHEATPSFCCDRTGSERQARSVSLLSAGPLDSSLYMVNVLRPTLKRQASIPRLRCARWRTVHGWIPIVEASSFSVI